MPNYPIPKRYLGSSFAAARGALRPPKQTAPRPTPSAPASPISPSSSPATPTYAQMYPGPDTYSNSDVDPIEQQYYMDQEAWHRDNVYQQQDPAMPKLQKPEPVIEEKFKHMLAIMGRGNSGGGGYRGNNSGQGLSKGLPRGGSFGGSFGGGLQSYVQDRMRKRSKFQSSTNTGSTQNRMLSRYLGGA